MASSNGAAFTPLTPKGSKGTVNTIGNEEFPGFPYLQRLRRLEHAFPALKGFLEKIKNVDIGRKLVQEHHNDRGRAPGRCYGLRFEFAVRDMA